MGALSIILVYCRPIAAAVVKKIAARAAIARVGWSLMHSGATRSLPKTRPFPLRLCKDQSFHSQFQNRPDIECRDNSRQKRAASHDQSTTPPPPPPPASAAPTRES